jgi:hypothetical protein
MIVAIVMSAIQLDNQTRFTALEVCDVTSNRRLSAKVKSEFAQFTQPRPKPGLPGGSLIFSIVWRVHSP